MLSPRARAVLILRDVLGFSARETAETLNSTTEAVAMTLSRARAALRERAPSRTTSRPPGPAPRPKTRLVSRLTAALTAHDVDAVVALLADDIRITMPPLPAVWLGRRDAALFLAEVAFRLVPQARFVATHANRQPALAVYTRDEANGLWRASGLLVLTVRGDQIAGLTRFESATLRSFDLPRILPG